MEISCVIFQDLQSNLRYVSDSIRDLLGWDPHSLCPTDGSGPSHTWLDLLHPSEVEAYQALHYLHLKNDMAATLTYLRLKKSDGEYILCVHSRSVVYDLIIGGLSKAVEPRPLTTATAEQVFVLNPEAARFSIVKWGQQTHDIFNAQNVDTTEDMEAIIARLSIRQGLLLNRFDNGATIMHSTNTELLKLDQWFNHSIFECIVPEDQANMRKLLDEVKTWATGSEGGFGYCGFRVMLPGNDESLSPTPTHIQAIVSLHSDAIVLVIRPNPHP